MAVEADWPDAYRVNRYVRDAPGADQEAVDALAGFERFPAWMWRNADVLDFIGWLRDHNDRLPEAQRAIGVIYRPESERISHYFRARLAEQFDAIVHLDETRAVEPLERTSRWDTGEVPETFPMGV